MANTDWPWEREVLAKLQGLGSNDDDAASSPSDESSMISLLKGVMVQNQTIISNQATIIAKLNAGIQVQVVTSL